MTDTFVVVGGDAAGMSAASKARRDDPDREVVVLDPERIVEERGIDLRTHHEVVAVDPGDSTVTVETDDDRYEQAYDDLLLATGGEATVPDVPGTDLDGVFADRNLDTGRALRRYSHRDRDRASPDGPRRTRGGRRDGVRPGLGPRHHHHAGPLLPRVVAAGGPRRP